MINISQGCQTSFFSRILPAVWQANWMLAVFLFESTEGPVRGSLPW